MYKDRYVISGYQLQFKDAPLDEPPGREEPGVPLESKELRFLSRMIAGLRAMMNHQVPVGYEDETGFHYGTGPASN